MTKYGICINEQCEEYYMSKPWDRGLCKICSRPLGEPNPVKMEEPRIPEFHRTLDKIRELHERKNHDYANADNPFSNFDFCTDVISTFRLDRDKVFATFISVKLARLAELLGRQDAPKNESIEDSFDDLITYCILWKCKVKTVSEAVENPSDPF